MTAFDLAGVHRFTDDIGIRMDRTLDDALRHYAEICREYRDGLRGWGRAVFAGRVAYDPEVERVWLEEGRRLYSRANDVYAHSRGSAGSRDSLEDLAALEAALGDLDRLVTEWVTPGPAVGPSAGRWRYPDQAATDDEGRRIASLPPLPAGWEPDDPGQRARYRELRRPGSGGSLRPRSPTEPTMPDRTPIPIEPVPIALDSSEFEAICGWPFVDDYVGRVLGAISPGGSSCGTAGSGSTAIRIARSWDSVHSRWARSISTSPRGDLIPIFPCWPSIPRCKAADTVDGSSST